MNIDDQDKEMARGRDTQSESLRPGPASAIPATRPSDDQIIDAISRAFYVRKSTAIEWLLGLNLAMIYRKGGGTKNLIGELGGHKQRAIDAEVEVEKWEYDAHCYAADKEIAEQRLAILEAELASVQEKYRLLCAQHALLCSELCGIPVKVR